MSGNVRDEEGREPGQRARFSVQRDMKKQELYFQHLAGEMLPDREGSSLVLGGPLQWPRVMLTIFPPVALM